jgi:hypothetical protein
MKRFLIALLLVTPVAKAEDFAQTWKTLSSYRITSAAKGAVVALLGYHAVKTGVFKNGEDFINASKALFKDDNVKIQDKVSEVAKTGVLTGGMAYVSYKLWWDYFREYARHALAL